MPDGPHRSWIAITLNVYGHLFANTDAKAAEIIEAAFARAEPNKNA